MIRKIITIDTDKCNGCGLCATACHESAIAIVNGKAKLIRDDYCDGLGNCLPACPTDAISFEEREALAYDDAAVKENQRRQKAAVLAPAAPASSSQLNQWPVQIKLVAPNAPFFADSDLLVAADCTAFAYGNFHNDFIKNHSIVIGCPKLDMIDYSEKLTEILRLNTINSITVTRMIVPCCGGIEYAVKEAIKSSGKDIPLRIVTMDLNGNIQ
ncbi:ATP-binding protein [Propionispira raffinosivorans]|uniref:ATP-binding protein n=1 Tax=Propionispira raffinosivorans TaxID=86959 RepID=UPI000371191F|nr:4Fe-4S binding protein [Propionispira raffinosivorans]